MSLATALSQTLDTASAIVPPKPATTSNKRVKSFHTARPTARVREIEVFTSKHLFILTNSQTLFSHTRKLPAVVRKPPMLRALRSPAARVGQELQVLQAAAAPQAQAP